jgi:hypothetical protein
MKGALGPLVGSSLVEASSHWGSSGAHWAPCGSRRDHRHLQPRALLLFGSQNNSAWNVQLPTSPHGGTHLQPA